MSGCDSKTAGKRLGLYLLVGVLLLGAVPGTGSAASTQLLTGCTTIDSGGTYVLDTSLLDSTQDPCISITADDVVLDGAGNTIDGVGSGVGVQVARGATNVTVQNLTVTGWNEAIDVHGTNDTVLSHLSLNGNNQSLDAGSTRNLEIRRSTITSPDRHAIEGFNVTNATIAGNTIESSGGVGIILGNSTGSTIVNNTVANTSSGGILLNYNSDNNTLDDNTVRNGSQGIYIHNGSDSNLLLSNTISRNRLVGVVVADSSRNVLDGNAVVNNTGDGVLLTRDSDDNQVYDTLVYNNSEDGIDVYNGSDGNTITGNNVSSSGSDGIVVTDSMATTIDRNRIQNSSIDGIALKRGSNETLVAHNVVANVTDDGIVLDTTGRNNTVWNNTIRNPGEHGIDLDGTAGGDRITENVIDMFGNGTQETADAPGIHLNHAPDETVYGNDVRDSDVTAVVLNASNGTNVTANRLDGGIELAYTSGGFVGNNTVNASGQNVGIGLLANSDNNTIVENTITSSRYVGLGLIEESDNNTLVDNVIEDTGILGVHLKSVVGTTLDGTVVRNVSGTDSFPGAGIRIFRSEAVSLGNAVLTNTSLGVAINASNGTVVSNVTTRQVANASLRVTNGSIRTSVTGLRLTTGIDTTVSLSGWNVSVTSVTATPSDPDTRHNISRYVHIGNTSANASVDLTVQYTDLAVDAADVDESSLALWRYDGNWSELSGSVVDTTVNAVSASTETFGLIAPLGEKADTGSTTSVPGTPSIDVSTDSIAFGQVPVNSSQRESVVIENDGSAPLAIDDVSLTETTSDGFAVVAGGNATTLAPGESREVVVRYTPSVVGDSEGTLEIGSNATDDSTVTVSLSGRGVAPSISVSPETVAFGSVSVDAAPPTRTVTFTNDGTDDLSVANITVDGANEDAFEIVEGGRTGTLAPGDSRTVTVAFTPQRDGNHSARLRLEGDGGQRTVAVGLSGRGLAPDLRVEPATLTYGNVTGDQTVTRRVTVYNDGSANLTVQDVRLFGPDSGAFGAAASNFTLGPGAQRSLTVTFDPDSPGAKSAYLRLLSDDPVDAQVDVYLTNTDTIIETEGSVRENRTRVNATIRNAEAGRPATVAVSRPETRDGVAAVDSITFTPETSGNVSLSVLQQQSPPASAPAFVRSDATLAAGYMGVRHSIPNEQVDNVTVTFRISKDRIRTIEDTEADEVALYRYQNGTYQELPTRVINETTTHYVYEARSPGLSDFVTGIKRAKFEIADAKVSVTEVRVGQGLEAIARVTNTGSADGTYVVKLRLRGEVVAKRSLTIAANGTRQTTFERAFEDPGVYQLYVNDIFVSNITVQRGQRTNGTATTTAGAETTQTTDTSMFGPGFGPVAALGALGAYAVVRRRLRS